jgi:hypothetical protein
MPVPVFNFGFTFEILGELRGFLLEQRAPYMTTCAGVAGSMSDSDRNQVLAFLQR